MDVRNNDSLMSKDMTLDEQKKDALIKIYEKQIELIDAILNNRDRIDWNKTFSWDKLPKIGGR